MGGKKKLSLKQTERMQKRRASEEKKRKGSKEIVKEKKTYGIIQPNPKNEEVISEIKKMRVLTPYTVSSRFNIRLSIAKDFLDQLEKNSLIQLVSANHNIKIYKIIP